MPNELFSAAASLDRQPREDRDKIVSLGGKNTVHVNKHDCLTIFTPGGGGYGLVGDVASVEGSGQASSGENVSAEKVKRLYVVDDARNPT